MEGIYRVLMVVVAGMTVKASVIPTPAAHCPSRADIIFVMDTSGSIRSNFPSMQEFAANLTDLLGDGDEARFGLMTFASAPTVQFHLNKYSTKVQTVNEISTFMVQVGGGTSTYRALQEVRNMFSSANGDRPGRSNIVIVMTDGYSNSYSGTVAEANLCKAEGIQMIAIGIGSYVNEQELQAMSSYPNSVFNAQSFASLSSLLMPLCTVAANPCADSPCENGACVEDGTDYMCNCTFGWAGRNCSELARFDCAANNPCYPLRIPDIYYYPAFSDSQYIQCSEWGHCFERGCAPNTFWVQTWLTCGNVTQSGTPWTQVIGGADCNSRNPCAVGETGYFIQSNRSEFVQCDEHGGCHEGHCPSNLVFDVRSKVCNWPALVP